MLNELMLAAAGAIGVGAGYAYASIRALEERCEVIRMARADITGAIDDLDSLLSESSTPQAVKGLAVFLLTGYADPRVGSRIVEGVMEAPADGGRSIENNPIEIALNEWGATNASLERQARRAFAILSLGLAVIHLGDRIKLMKVEQRAVRDPLWAKIGVPSFEAYTPARVQ